MTTIKSIEEKAKRYDEAIEIAKDINNEQRAQPFNIMTRVFPELAESEDERIRKALIDYFRWNTNSQLLNEFTNREVFAWLEKQGELKYLKDKHTWKPSNEQMNALSIAVKHGQTDDPDALKKLLEQLKKHYL